MLLIIHYKIIDLYLTTFKENIEKKWYFLWCILHPCYIQFDNGDIELRNVLVLIDLATSSTKVSPDYPAKWNIALISRLFRAFRVQYVRKLSKCQVMIIYKISMPWIVHMPSLPSLDLLMAETPQRLLLTCVFAAHFTYPLI